MDDNKQLVLSPDNPFNIDVRNMLTGTKTRTHAAQLPGGTLKETFTVTREYIPSGKWCKLYQNAAVLGELSPFAAQLFIRLALTVEYNAEKVYMTQPLSRMTHRSYPQAIAELTAKRIIVKEKRGWYWLNVTILVMGQARNTEVSV